LKKSFSTLEGFEKVREAGQRGNLIFVPCHKSHIDYLLLNNLMYQHYMHPPRIAAGKNLAFWPLGPFFRGSGAFFIRRRFLGGKLYAEVLYHYLKTLIKTGYSLEFFIEGGRSRTGKLVLPKIGLLNMILRAYFEGAARDLIFVPTFIGYDQVLEEKAYLSELEGKKKETENVGQLVRARKFLKRRYGRAYIQFSEPLSLNEHLARNPAPNADETEKIRTVSNDLASEVVQAINRISVVTPFALVCAALLTYPRKGVYRRELLQIIQVLYDYLKARKVPLADSLDNLNEAVEETLALCEVRKLITPIEKEEGLSDELGLGGYSIDETKRPLLEYYKNNIIHFFLPAAMVSLATLSGPGFEFEAGRSWMTSASSRTFSRMNSFSTRCPRRPWWTRPWPISPPGKWRSAWTAGENPIPFRPPASRKWPTSPICCTTTWNPTISSSAPSNTCRKNPGAKRSF
jgi:glycerol-3-phosphate O-acyltransferase